MSYVPNQGDLVKMSFSPQAGKESKGWRPGLVISKKEFNEKTKFAFVCPITRTDKSYVFHPKLPEGLKCHGFVEIDQVRSLDYIGRNMRYEDKVNDEFLDEVLALFEAIFWDVE